MASNIEEIKRRVAFIPRTASVTAGRSNNADAAIRAVTELCGLVVELAQEVERIERTLPAPEDQQ